MVADPGLMRAARRGASMKIRLDREFAVYAPRLEVGFTLLETGDIEVVPPLDR